MIIYVDIDDTICSFEPSDLDIPTPERYEKAKPIWINIDKINDLYDDGNKIVYYTARCSIHKERYSEVYGLTKKQLLTWGCKHNELIIGHKPVYDLLICDKAKRIEEI